MVALNSGNIGSQIPEMVARFERNIHWDGNGFWLLYKRLEKHTFKWPKIKESLTNIIINEQQLSWLLEGLSIEQKRAFKKTETKYI